MVEPNRLVPVMLVEPAWPDAWDETDVGAIEPDGFKLSEVPLGGNVTPGEMPPGINGKFPLPLEVDLAAGETSADNVEPLAKVVLEEADMLEAPGKTVPVVTGVDGVVAEADVSPLE